MTTTQTFWHGVLGAVMQGIIWGGPLLLTSYPHVGDLTVSAIVGILVAWAHTKYLSN